MKIYGKEDFNFMLPSKQEIIRLRNFILKEKIVFGMENINCCKLSNYKVLRCFL